MGIPNSKVVTDTKSEISLAEINTPSVTLLSTPPKSIDPRSPSADIARTPIETLPSLLNIYPECKLLVPSNVEEIDKIDSEINKTPISIKQNSFKVDKDIRRKLLKDSALKIIEKTDKITALCDQIIESNNAEEINSDTSLTEMNTPDKFKIKIGLLETDIDFIETDIDQVYKKSHKLGLFCVTPRDILHAKLKKQMENNADINIMELMDPRSPTVGIDRTPVQVIKPLDIDPRSPTIDFERTPIQIPLESYENIRSNEIVVNVENFEQKLDILCITDSEDEKCKSDDSFTRVMSKEKSISEISLEKVVLPKRNLIYEDEECSTPNRKIQNVKQNESNGRTPLGIRNGNGAHCRSKSANGRLPSSEQKMNKNDLKNAYAVSKIPVFNNKNMKKVRGKIQQCENTPPMNLNDMKLSKRAQWDSDSTMII